MYKLCFFVPVSHLEMVKQSIFEVGAGKIGNYDYCCWQTLGQGQFRPLKGSSPFMGEQSQIEKVEEYKVECVCSKEVIGEVLLALKCAHPYEEPAYEVSRLESL